MSLKMRAHLGTASHFCEVVVLKLRKVPIGKLQEDGILLQQKDASLRRRADDLFKSRVIDSEMVG